MSDTTRCTDRPSQTSKVTACSESCLTQAYLPAHDLVRYCADCTRWYHITCLQPVGNLQWALAHQRKRLPAYLTYMADNLLEDDREAEPMQVDLPWPHEFGRAAASESGDDSQREGTGDEDDGTTPAPGVRTTPRANEALTHDATPTSPARSTLLVDDRVPAEVPTPSGSHAGPSSQRSGFVQSVPSERAQTRPRQDSREASDQPRAASAEVGSELGDHSVAEAPDAGDESDAAVSRSRKGKSVMRADNLSRARTQGSEEDEQGETEEENDEASPGEDVQEVPQIAVAEGADGAPAEPVEHDGEGEDEVEVDQLADDAESTGEETVTYWQESSDEEEDLELVDFDNNDFMQESKWASILYAPVERAWLKGLPAVDGALGLYTFERIILEARSLKGRPKDINKWLKGVLDRKYKALTNAARKETERMFFLSLDHHEENRVLYVCPNGHVL